MRPWPFAAEPVATTDRSAPVLAMLGAVGALFAINPFFAGRTLGDHATAITVPLTLLLPLVLGGYTWRHDKSFRRGDLTWAVTAGALALAGGPVAAVGTTVCVLVSLALLRACRIGPPTFGWVRRRGAFSGLWAAVVTATAVAAVLIGVAGGPVRGSSVGLYDVLIGLASGVSQEAGLRLLLFAAAIYLLGGYPKTRSQQWWCLLLLTLPQALLYSLGHLVALNPAGVLIEGGMVALLYSLPMALLLRKRGVVPAVVCHVVVDVALLAML